MKFNVFLQIEGMKCEDCATHLLRALQKLQGIEKVQMTDWRSKRANLVTTQQWNEQEVLQTIEALGYQGTVIERMPIGMDSEERSKAYDLLIVGGGSAAFAAAIKASELGAKVGIVESGVIGGTCVNVGCVPSKFLIRAAEVYTMARNPRFAGLGPCNMPLDWAQLSDQKEKLVSMLRMQKYLHLLDVYPNISLIEGKARLMAGNQLIVNNKTYTSRKILLATGSSPSIPPIPGLKETGFLDSTTALSVKTLPSSLAIIGGGTIGLELGQMFARFGVKVHIIEALPSIAMSEEPEIREQLSLCLKEERIELLTNTQVRYVEKTGENGCFISIQNGKKGIGLRVEKILVTTGRSPNTAELGLEEVGVKKGSRGEILVDSFLRTTNPDIYAAGDCAGFPQFVYVSAYTGGIAAENAIKGAKRSIDFSALPRVTFTDPQIASVGLTEAQAKKEGLNVVTSIFPFKEVPKAIISLDTRGLIKLVIEKNTEKLLGAHLLAAAAGDFIQEAVVALRHGLTIQDIVDGFHPYLTMSEAIKLAALSFKKDVGHLSCCAS
ncbi:mercury(II) reductase [Methylacidiphilum sp. Yel]|uniref:mercury(II) reductase n=1 Tax=Methylacidiphilum sp. Yel TaxID=1847730 RepID=UPI00106CD189|nr:mercury(II) reductase [Methylacidiphilum sp. Yel]